MPKTKFQEVVFTVLMSFTMAYAMEFYNLSLMNGGPTYSLFFEVLKEAWWVTIIVVIVQTFFGGPIARKMAFKTINFQTAAPYAKTLMMGVCTVCIMCPTMSLVATILFKNPWGNLLPLWLKTVAFNFPMAFFFQLFFAGPFVRRIFRLIFVTAKS